MVDQLRSLSLITAPTAAALILDDVKEHLNIINSTDDDAQIDRWIATATQQIEDATRRCLITQTWDFRYDAFPSVIVLPKAPVQSVTYISYTDSNGANQTLDSSLYEIDLYSEPTTIEPVYAEVWPTTRDIKNSVRVRCICGYGDNPSDIDPKLRNAMLTMIAHYDAHRGDGMTNAELPMPWQRTLWEEKVPL